MNLTLKPASGLSGSALKVIAMISMVIDHIALYLMEHGTVLYETMWKNRSMLLQQMNRRMSPISPFGLFLPYIGYQ